HAAGHNNLVDLFPVRSMVLWILKAWQKARAKHPLEKNACRNDAALRPFASVLPYGALTLSVSRRTVRAEGFHASGGRQGARTQRPSYPGRLPPLAEHRLPARLRELPGLRVGAHPGAGVLSVDEHEAHSQAQ